MTTHLNPQWIVGFVDGEGCFSIEVTNTGQIQVSIVVVQGEVDIQILHAFKDYFGCGSVTVNREDANGIRYQWRVKSVSAFVEKIVSFFDQHKLKTKRRIEYQRVRAVALMLQANDHTDPVKKAKMLRMAELYRIGGRSTRKLNALSQDELQQRISDLSSLDKEFGIVDTE